MHVPVSVRYCKCMCMRTCLYACIRTQYKATRVEL